MAEYLTVKEFARKYGKDPGNIRLMLLNGAIKGEKLGSQWIIPKDTPYPPDRRIKSGDYRNWRKKLSVARNSPELMNVLTEMCSRMERIYGDMLEKVILYGSYARGEQTEDSDVDIAVFLKSEETAEMHSSMLDIVVDCELDAGVTLSFITLETDEFLEWKRTLPFYGNIDREGIIIWKAAQKSDPCKDMRRVSKIMDAPV